MVLRLSLFAVTTLLGREPAFTGAGPCLKRGQRQHADGRLVSTRSCSLRPCARRHCGGTHLSDCKGAAVPLRWLSNRLRSAQPNPPYARRWAGATSPHQCQESTSPVRYERKSRRNPYLDTNTPPCPALNLQPQLHISHSRALGIFRNGMRVVRRYFPKQLQCTTYTTCTCSLDCKPHRNIDFPIIL